MQKRYAIWVCFIALFGLIFLIINRSPSLHSDKIDEFAVVMTNDIDSLASTIKHLQALKFRVSECLLKQLIGSKAFWKDFTPAIEACSGFLHHTLEWHILRNWDDFKFAVLPVQNRTGKFSDDQCTVVTIGIGNDIESEKKLAALLPYCKFIGLDPIYESGKIYEKIGTFFNVAVSDQNHTIRASVLTNGSYVGLDVKSVNFFDILKTTGTKLIDFLFLDAEGAEYAIFPMLKKFGRRKSPYSICQISAEIHGFHPIYNMTEEQFKSQILDVLANSPFLPISGTKSGFNRMFWMDFESPSCIKKYLADFWAIPTPFS